ncbi:hypothetical protein [Belliella pelovolcani]|uniref:hypothetical protein n=1 Tax=Belliella pelovolcani TaxID=529505 RepID=UPI001FE72FB3|nr:hypothetical protein [Belliella pelovolcani]
MIKVVFTEHRSFSKNWSFGEKISGAFPDNIKAPFSTGAVLKPLSVIYMPDSMFPTIG